MLKKIKEKLKSSIRKKTKSKANKKVSPKKPSPKKRALKKSVAKKHETKRPRKIKDPEAKQEAKRYENPVASRTLILKAIKKGVK